MDSEDTRARSVGTDVEGRLEGQPEDRAVDQSRDKVGDQSPEQSREQADGRVEGAVKVLPERPAGDHAEGRPDEPASLDGPDVVEGRVDAEPPTTPISPTELSMGVKSVSVARQVDGARAWESSDRLARLAMLVTGSPDRAYRLTRQTLISVGRSGPYVQARRKLMRQAIRTRVDGYATGLLPGLAGPTPAARLWRRLMSLPAVERALVVLTEAEGMADAVAGAVLGLPRVETEQTLARVRQSLEAHAQLTESERREVFAGPALLPASGMVPTQALARAQRGRRLRATLTALATVAVLAAGVVSVVTLRSDHGDLPRRNIDSLSRVDDPMRWATRGDLLGDSGLLRAAVRSWRARGYQGNPGDAAHPGHRPELPTLLWAGRLTQGRSLVVLAGRGLRGDPLIGVLLDAGDGAGVTLVRTLAAAPTPALDLGAVRPDDPASHRYLVSPWFSSLSVVRPDARTVQDTELLGLHNGLSGAWSNQDEACSPPLLALVHTASSGLGGTGRTFYALDASVAGPAVAVSDLPPYTPGEAAYFTALHGLNGCADQATGQAAGQTTGKTTTTGPSLWSGMNADHATVADLTVTPVWSGKLPDGTAGQALQLSWRINPRSAGPGPTPGWSAQAFALVTGGSARYSTVRVGTGALVRSVGGVTWTSARNRHGYLLLVSSPGITTLDLRPRPKGFTPRHTVAFLGLPTHGQRFSVVGLDKAGRPVSVEPMDF